MPETRWNWQQPDWDLQGLVDLGILKKTGELKGTRYWLQHS
jgi:hypothetical protein